MAQTKSLLLTDSYQLITDGLSPVFISPGTHSDIRIAVADTTPDDDSDDFVYLPKDGVTLTLETATNNVYARIEYGENAVLRWLEGGAIT